MKRRNVQLREYTVGWVCALPIELAAAQEMLDEEHDDLPYGDPADTNIYTLGRISDHNVVIVCLPAGLMGNNCSAAIAAQLKARFTSIRFGLMVGIGGGVPSAKFDIRLGDVVISQPDKQHGGVVQYDFGKTLPGGFQRTGTLSPPPTALLNALSKFRASRYRGKSSIEPYISSLRPESPFHRHNAESDVLYEPQYLHVEGSDCSMCSLEKRIIRQDRENDRIEVHYGTIASGNQVMRNGATRDKVSAELGGVLCFEMEAAGLMNSFPCLVIRGICDYSDSHKNKIWQPYAAATAAACAKEILRIIPATEIAVTSAPTHESHLNTQSHEEKIQSIIERGTTEWFTSILSLGQSENPSPAKSINADEVIYHWIFRNIDFTNWQARDSSSVLWLSALYQTQIEGVSSHIVTEGKKLALSSQSQTFAFYCSGDTSFSMLIHTVLHQILRSSVVDETSAIKVFLDSLLQSYFHDLNRYLFDRELKLHVTDNLKQTASTLLCLEANSLSTALVSVLVCGKRVPISIIIDGLDQVQGDRNDFFQSLRSFIDTVQSKCSNIKILLTSLTDTNIQSVFETLPCIEYDKERKECLSHLQFDNTRFSKILHEHEGTCDWLWSHFQYHKWSKPDSSDLLLIEGKPGSGKSTLTKYFYNNLLPNSGDKESTVLASFFYSYREGELQRSHKNMLRSVLYDILSQDEAFFYHRLQSVYRMQLTWIVQNGWTYSSLKTVLKSLVDYPMFKKFHLVLDAVDESEDSDRRDIINILYGICSDVKHCIIKIFVASRPIGELQMRRCKTPNIIKLQDETLSAISLFTRSLLDDLEMSHTMDQALDYIVQNAQGVFLWVRLIGEELLEYEERGCSEYETLEFLKSLPTELKHFYQHMLGKMRRRETEKRDTIRMFQFVLFARRSIKLDELLHSMGIIDDLALEFKSSDYDLKKRIPSKRRLVFCGGNFLETRSQNGCEFVQIMHQTVREFFLDPEGDVANSDLKISKADAHFQISITCIRYLMICAAKADFSNSPQIVEHWKLEDFVPYLSLLNEMPLACYALSFLRDHIENCDGNTTIQEMIKKLARELDCSSSRRLFSKWVHSSLDSNVRLHSSASTDELRNTALSVASELGLPIAAEILLRCGADINATKNGKTPLCLSSWKGHDSVVQLLIGYPGVELNAKDNGHQTALSLAAEFGHQKVVKLLLETRRVDVETWSKSKRTPLSYAAEGGFRAVVEILLAPYNYKRQNKSASGKFELGKPSWYANFSGHEELAKFLLENGH